MKLSMHSASDNLLPFPSILMAPFDFCTPLHLPVLQVQFISVASLTHDHELIFPLNLFSNKFLEKCDIFKLFSRVPSLLGSYTM